MFWWKVKNFIFRAIHPSFWIKVDSCVVCWEYDQEIKTAIENGAELKRPDHYHVMLNNRCLWVRNYPYYYGHEVPATLNSLKMPSPITVWRLNKYVKKQTEMDHYLRNL